MTYVDLRPDRVRLVEVLADDGRWCTGELLAYRRRDDVVGLGALDRRRRRDVRRLVHPGPVATRLLQIADIDRPAHLSAESANGPKVRLSLDDGRRVEGWLEVWRKVPDELSDFLLATPGVNEAASRVRSADIRQRNSMVRSTCANVSVMNGSIACSDVPAHDKRVVPSMSITASRIGRRT
jgi:hypothetical protein